MDTPEQFREKAAEYAALAKTATGPDEAIEFQKLETSFTTLADNEQWMADHPDQTVHAEESGQAGDVASAEEKK